MRSVCIGLTSSIVAAAPCVAVGAGPVAPASVSGTAEALAGDENSLPTGPIIESDALGIPGSNMLSAEPGFPTDIAQLDYSLAQVAGVALFTFDTFTDLAGGGGDAVSTVSLSFTTTQPAFFELFGTVSAPNFSTSFAGITEDRFPDISAPGGVGGSIGAGGVFDQSGMIAPGEYTLTISASATIVGATPVGGESFTTLRLIKIPGPGTAGVLLAWGISLSRRRRV